MTPAAIFLSVLLCGAAVAQTAENVLVVVNRKDAVSVQVGEYYQTRRSIPAANICSIATAPAEDISWQTYVTEIEQPIGDCLKKGGLQEKILYIVTTLGVPLKMTQGEGGTNTENCAVDSELALLYSKLKGISFARVGRVPNPFYGKRDTPFRHPDFPIYLVTRLGGWDFAQVKAIIDRALLARNQGRVILDLKGNERNDGNDWLRNAATLLPRDRVVLDETPSVLRRQTDVIGYASWGSNDPGRRPRFLQFQWLPGAIVTDFVSTNGRTLQKPPDTWTYQIPFMGWQQSLSTDYLQDGATGAAGNVYEPYLNAIPRPDYLFPAYLAGRNLAESYYLAMPFLSWQEIVLGDPLCALAAK